MSPTDQSFFSSHRQSLFTVGVCGLLLMLTVLAGCTKRSPPPPDDALSKLEPISEAVNVDLFFDATLSMKGFVLTKTTSSYQSVVPLLERGVIEGWRGGQVSFYKFGDDIAPLAGRQYLEAIKPSFYSDSKYNRKTLIERVIDRSAQDHLTVVVTDLFQTNSDINQLSEKLKQRFVANNLCVGIYAIRSQFEGPIYDVGPDAFSFVYNSTAQPESERPFYLLTFGKHADIAHFFDVLDQAGLNAIAERHALIFSRYLASQYLSFSRAKLKTADRISEISTSNLLSGHFDDDRVKAFKLTKSKPTARFSSELQCDSFVKNVMEYSNDLTAEVTAWKGEDKGGRELIPTESPQAQRAFRVMAKLLPDQPPYDKLELEGNINTADFPGPGVYQYRILLRPNHFTLPGWVSLWTMRDEEVRRWHQKPSEFNGAKTYNLENFLGTLLGAVLSTTQPNVGEVYCYIRVDK
jgi:hypothetical protein